MFTVKIMALHVHIKTVTESLKTSLHYLLFHCLLLFVLAFSFRPRVFPWVVDTNMTV